ncbi:MAG: PAS domain S-box protein [Methanobacteriaceae archaeon]|nr:PAS domain S-box protein [Methanobacteriaceae archaeon]MDP2836162.1 PAS domain S-box protein [Methanobacteriaceae archaeon]MDP3035464.1 PAS domain S-box protein [Methanobacteriaceae archaeon]MDP3622977.1 PAS domain S-box protein [Methanobacteriaceae archaeon]
MGAENRIKKLLESTSDGFISVDTEMRVVYFNSAAEKILKRGRHEIIGMNLFEAFPRIKGSFFEEKYYESIENERKVCFEGYFGEPPHEKWYYFRIIPNSHEISIFLRNITKEKKTEQILTQEKEKYQLLADNATEIIFTHDSEGICTYISPYVKKLLGYSSEELISKNVYNLIHPSERDLIKQKQKYICSKNKIVSLEHRLLKKNGTYLWVESKTNSVKDTKGEFQYFIVTIRDLTHDKKTEKHLNETENYYRTIFENTGTASIIIEKDKTISLVNSEFAKLYGLPKEEIEGQLKCTSFVHPDYQEMMGRYQSQRFLNPDSVPRNYEFKFLDHEQKSKDIFNTASIIPGTEKTLLSLMDVSERNNAVDRLKWELKVNESLNKIYAPLVSSQTSLEDIASVILTQAMELTESEVGFVSELITGTKNMKILSMMPPIPDNYYFSNRVIRTSDNENNSLMRHSLDEKEGFFTNDASQHNLFKNIRGHLNINKFLSVPVLNEGINVGQIAVSNSKKDYSKNDLEALERLADFYTLALQKVGNENKILESLEEKKVLLREIHHRVKNNLQIISSLLNLQSQYIEDNKTQDVLIGSQNRVRSMALIHEKLYGSISLNRIDFGEYVENLSESLINSYIEIPGNVRMHIDIKNIYLNIETAIPCGLMINELISNSLKHGFKDSKGNIKIQMAPKNEEYILKICDDGIGFPEKIDFRNTETLGMQLINSLVKQLDGEIKLVKNSGSCFIVNFKELCYKKRI